MIQPKLRKSVRIALNSATASIVQDGVVQAVANTEDVYKTLFPTNTIPKTLGFLPPSIVFFSNDYRCFILEKQPGVYPVMLENAEGVVEQKTLPLSWHYIILIISERYDVVDSVHVLWSQSRIYSTSDTGKPFPLVNSSQIDLGGMFSGIDAYPDVASLLNDVDDKFYNYGIHLSIPKVNATSAPNLPVSDEANACKNVGELMEWWNTQDAAVMEWNLTGDDVTVDSLCFPSEQYIAKMHNDKGSVTILADIIRQNAVQVWDSKSKTLTKITA